MYKKGTRDINNISDIYKISLGNKVKIGSYSVIEERTVEIELIKTTQHKPKPSDDAALGFGDIFTDHMFHMKYEQGKGWFAPKIKPYENISLDPAAMVLHYAQEIFEGLKAYCGKDNHIYLFRPRDNFARLNRSAKRMCMPEVDIDLVMEGMKRLILVDRDWIPSNNGTSLYIRPTMFATEPHLGVRPSKTYVFFIILSPVGAYYKEGLNPVKIYVEDEYIRAAPKGTGEVKTGGNYAASLLSAEKAKARGFTQVLWLDAIEHKYVEEVGTMNVFFVIDDELIVIPFSGSILPGLTRDSVIKIAKHWGIRIRERRLSIDEVIETAKNGRLKEAFGTGTAAVISPIGQITYKGNDYTISGGRMGKLSQDLYHEIVGIQYGDREDIFGWREKID